DLLRRSRILPEAWTYGFLHFLDHAQTPPSFLMGEYSETGWHRYFLVTFLLKTPIPLLLLGLAAVVLTVRGGFSRADLFVSLPFGVYFLLPVSRSINIGHRHLLPVYPFLFVAAGRAAHALTGAGAGPGRGRKTGPAAHAVP